jgi:hypothetical protein
VAVAAAAVVVAFVAMIWQAKQTHASASVSNMWRFLDVWDSGEMHTIRAKASASLKVQGDADEIVDLLGFFEELGFLVRRRSLGADTAWAMFSDWALPYWKAAEYFITEDRREDPTLWEEFAFLNRKLLSIESDRRRKPSSDVRPNKEDVDQLLRGESRLTPSSSRIISPSTGLDPSTSRTFSAWRRRRQGHPRPRTTDHDVRNNPSE